MLASFTTREALSSGALHCLKTIVHPMPSQFHSVFHGFRLSCETNIIVDLKFSLVPGDNCMRPPHTFLVMSNDRDRVPMMYDLLHLESKSFGRIAGESSPGADQEPKTYWLNDARWIPFTESDRDKPVAKPELDNRWRGAYKTVGLKLSSTSGTVNPSVPS